MELKPCPFCGSKSIVFNWGEHEGIISCACGARMKRNTMPEYFVHIGEDIYRKIPMQSGKELTAEAWNRRADNG